MSDGIYNARYHHQIPYISLNQHHIPKDNNFIPYLQPPINMHLIPHILQPSTLPNLIPQPRHIPPPPPRILRQNFLPLSLCNRKQRMIKQELHRILSLLRGPIFRLAQLQGRVTPRAVDDEEYRAGGEDFCHVQEEAGCFGHVCSEEFV